MVLEDILHLKRVVPEVMFCEDSNVRPADSPCCSINDQTADPLQYGSYRSSSVLSESGQETKIRSITTKKNRIIENMCALPNKRRISYQPTVVTVSPPESGDEGNASFTSTTTMGCSPAFKNTSGNFPIRSAPFSYDCLNPFSLQNVELIVCTALVNMHGMKNV